MKLLGRQKPPWLLTGLVTALCTFIICLADQNVTEQCNSTTGIANIVNRMSHRLTTTIGGTENLFFSPLSISVSLAMAYLGARGNTAAQMESQLGYDEILGNASLVHRQFRNMLNSLENGTDEYKLLVANGLFAQDGYEILQNYTSGLKKHYNAKVNTLNFTSDSQGSMEHINTWVLNHTEGKIAELVSEPFDPMTVLVLLNGIYFQGFWKYPFSEQLTYDRKFHSINGTFRRIPFMEFKKPVNYFWDVETNHTFLELDYRGDHISMIFALPNSKTQHPTLKITSELLCNVRNNFRLITVHVMIPKFKMEYERELISDMNAMGLNDLFTENASNLTGIRLNNDLFVGSMIHKAVIEVNEQGTEAAGVSGMSFFARSGHSRPLAFKANHPFVFCIVDKRNGAILFMGRVVNP